MEEPPEETARMEAVGRLAGGIAHEFNNLLNVVIGYTQMAMADLEPEDERREQLAQVLAAGERAASLTRQLLVFSRKRSPQFWPLDLGEVARGLREKFERQIGTAHTLEIDAPAEELVAQADLGQVEQLLDNLVQNAAEAMPGGGAIALRLGSKKLPARLAARFPWTTAGCACVAIAVEDAGTGMTPDVRAHLFEPFFSTKAKGKLAGLGMAAVYGTVRAHGGAIDVRSQPGEGTLVTVYLPIEGCEESQREAGETAETPAPTTSPKEVAGEESPLILLAEDDEALAAFARTILTKAGYRVLHAADGAEAVRLFRKRRDEIALLLLDVVMPEKTGAEVYREVREAGSPVPVLFSSGFDNGDLRDLSTGDEKIKLIEKPYDPQTLLREIGSRLGR